MLESIAAFFAPKPNPEIGGEDGIEVLYHTSQLKHTKSYPVDAIWITFSSHEVVRNLAVDFLVHADNVIEPLKGQFHFKFDGVA